MSDPRMFSPMLFAIEHVWTAQRLMLEAMTEATARTAAALARAPIGDITIYFPFGSGYHQEIEPYTNWGWVDTTRTELPALERDIVQRAASYGKQLGRMTDLLVSVAENTEGVDQEKLAAVKQLKARVEREKAKYDLAG